MLSPTSYYRWYIPTECLDARDDYHAQMKKGDDVIFPYSGEGPESEFGKFDQNAFGNTEYASNGDEIPDHICVADDAPLGKAELK